MGRTEWGLLVRSDDDIRYWLQVAREHNTWEDPDEVGEPLIVASVLNYVSTSAEAQPKVPTGKYLLMHNGGGRSYTMEFLQNRSRPGDVILGLGDKPENWCDCDEMAWERPQGQDPYTVPDLPALFT